MNIDATDGEDPSSQIPVIYVACPLTGLEDLPRRAVGAQLNVIKNAIKCVTEDDRVSDDTWPVSVYVPFDHTPPWGTDQMTPAQIYRQNLLQVHYSDALIVLGENGASAGIGQELEWSTRLGLPVLYLSPGDPSRQVRGTPGVTAVTYNNDIETLELQTKNFMRRAKSQIEAGPRRRSSRELRYAALRVRLQGAWGASSNRTEVASSCGLSIEALDLLLEDATLLAMQPIDSILSLAAALDVSLEPFVSSLVMLPAAAMRALLGAAESERLSDDRTDKLAIYGLAMLSESTGGRLTTVDEWVALRRAKHV